MSACIEIKTASPGSVYITNGGGSSVVQTYAQGSLFPVYDFDGTDYYCTLQFGHNDLSPALSKNKISDIVCKKDGTTVVHRSLAEFQAFVATYCFYTAISIVNGRTGGPTTLAVGAQMTNASLPVAIATDQVPIPVTISGSYARFTAASTLVGPYIYTGGMTMGGFLSFPNAMPNKMGTLKSITIVDIDNVNAVLGIVIYNLAPVGTYNDATAYTIDPADAGNVLGLFINNIISIGGVSTIPCNIGITGSEVNLYAQIVMKSSGTYTQVAAITVQLGIQY